jgi:hypothetical protein
MGYIMISYTLATYVALDPKIQKEDTKRLTFFNFHVP